jgi:hypothetical protein
VKLRGRERSCQEVSVGVRLQKSKRSQALRSSGGTSTRGDEGEDEGEGEASKGRLGRTNRLLRSSAVMLQRKL